LAVIEVLANYMTLLQHPRLAELVKQKVEPIATDAQDLVAG